MAKAFTFTSIDVGEATSTGGASADLMSTAFTSIDASEAALDGGVDTIDIVKVDTNVW